MMSQPCTKSRFVLSPDSPTQILNPVRFISDFIRREGLSNKTDERDRISDFLMELGSIFLSQQYTLYHNWSISCLSGFSQTAIKTPVSTHVTQVKYIAVLAAHSK